MNLLRTPRAADAYDNPSRVPDRAPIPAPGRARTHTRALVRRAIALLVYGSGYPLLALALWIGARDGGWTRASVLVGLGVFMSFLGWGLLNAVDEARNDGALTEFEIRPVASTVFLALYNRAGAIIVLLGSYAVAARTQGWPAPETFVGWFALVWIPLFVSLTIPVESAARPRDPTA